MFVADTKEILRGRGSERGKFSTEGESGTQRVLFPEGLRSFH